MADYKAMYYYLAGRMATAVEALDATTGALVEITEKMKDAQRATEEMFMNSEEAAISMIEGKLYKDNGDKK
jgi:hypothetical protein